MKKNIVFPLSPNPSLGESGDDKSTKAYFEFLNNVLDGQSAQRIHNIAVTGSFGVGKSSLIRSFERDRLNKKTG